jgi:hypothetical protein
MVAFLEQAACVQAAVLRFKQQHIVMGHYGLNAVA